MFPSFGNSFFDNFDDILSSLGGSFRTRRGSGTRLMKQVLLSTHTSGIFAQRRAFTAGAPEWRRFRLSIGKRTPKKIVQKGSVRVDRR